MMNCPPVLLILFNRPEYTDQVFTVIREAQPRQFFIAADGPRSDHPDDPSLCAEARAVVEQVNWECEIHTLYRDYNLGCKISVSSAITWFFEYVDAGIILEDDCLPAIEFFPFCETLLKKYHGDDRIGMISGNNFGFDLYDKTLSYSFSRHGHIWGWATWKRCWDKLDINSNYLNATNIALIKTNISENSSFVEAWWQGVDAVLHQNLDTWDSQWGVARYSNNYLTIRPKVNLVANIGFGGDATHTTGTSKNVFTVTGNLEFPLVHPNIVVPDRIADAMLEKFFLSTVPKRTTFMSRVTRRIKDRILSYVLHLIGRGK
jgi:hypothetical protein